MAQTEPFKVWMVSLPERKSRALFFSVDSPNEIIGKKVCLAFAVSFFAWSADKNYGSVAQGKTSSACSILFPIYFVCYKLNSIFGPLLRE